MTRHPLWDQWLTAASLGMVLFGLLMILFIQTELFAGLTERVDRAFWPAGDGSTELAHFQKWVYGAWGATLAALGLLAAFVARHAFARRRRWARDAMAAAVISWYILDTSVSVVSQVWANVLLNTAVFLLFLPPILATWQEFSRGRE